MDKQSLTAIEELWDAWELHFLIILSLCLQVSLYVFADRRRCSVSWVPHTFLWLAYLSADSVAIFVLGHLAVNASQPRHHLIAFWAPFLLIHLGGQDTITALSKQDNELWLRHFLSVATQVTVAGYVVAKTSWPDRRLNAAMMLMYITGCFKYAERTYCLYRSRPTKLMSESLYYMSQTADIEKVFQNVAKRSKATRAHMIEFERSTVRTMFSKMLLGAKGFKPRREWDITEIVSVDAPLNRWMTFPAEAVLPDLHEDLFSKPDRYRFYEFVGAELVHSYQRLYTKRPLRESIFKRVSGSCPVLGSCIYALFHCVPSLITLVLFVTVEKEGKLQNSSRADIIVSYILLVGALFLDVTSSILSAMSFLSYDPLRDNKILNAVLHAAGCIEPAWSQKQWSEQLAQYSMVKRYDMQDTTACKRFLQKWVSKIFGVWGTDLFDTTHTPITGDYKLVKEYILDSLVFLGSRKEWNISNSRGLFALQNYDSNSTLYKCTGSGVDFPTSVLIWHIATEICYYYGDSIKSDKDKEYVLVSRQLSQYIMYLVFKCGVMRTTNTQFVHDSVLSKIRDVMSDKPIKDAVMNLFQHKEEEETTYLFAKREEENYSMDEMQETTGNVASSSSSSGHVHELVQQSNLEALYSSVLPRARAAAQELISLEDETTGWSLISAVWIEMIFYAAPRCGGAFHYEHLCTGGELATHVLLLMQSLGPFLPTPGASTC